MSDVQIIITDADREAELLNNRAADHLRKLKTLGHALESFVDDVQRLKRKMLNDGSIQSEMLKGLNSERLINRRVQETKDLISLFGAVVSLVNGQIDLEDMTKATADKKTGKKKSGADILSVHSIVTGGGD